jgi:CheY-like chemotaxis protein
LEAKLHPYNLILLDMMMPVMNGWQFREQQIKEASISVVPAAMIFQRERPPGRSASSEAS